MAIGEKMPDLHISVALCTYNGARFLREQLDSIASQTRLPDELVICDDGSGDGTMDIVRSFASNSPFPVRALANENNLGSTKNFEKAIGLCGGDIIVLSDQDDVWMPEKLWMIESEFLRSDGVGLVFTDAERVDESLRGLGSGLWDSIGFSMGERECIRNGRPFNVLLNHNVVTGATMAFRSSYRGRVMPIPSCWVHDAWITLMIAATGELAMIDKPLIRYRQHSVQQIGAPNKERYAEHMLNESRIALDEPDAYLGRSRRNHTAMIDRSLAQYASAYERLSAIDDPGVTVIMPQLEAKLKHLRARTAMSRKKWPYRLPVALRELISLRYHRYTDGGINVILKDLFL